GVKGRRNWITREAAGEGKTFQGKELEISAIKKLATGIGKTNGPQAGADGNVFAKTQPSIRRAGKHRLSAGAGLPQRCFIHANTAGDVLSELIDHSLAGIDRTVS